MHRMSETAVTEKKRPKKRRGKILRRIILWVLLLEEGQTEAVVELRPEEGTLLPLGLSVRVETDG